MKRLILLTLIANSLILVLPIHANDTSEVPCIEVTPDNLTPSEACQNLMEDNLEPVVNEIPEDRYTLSTYSYWRVGPQAVNMYDSPNGSVVGHQPEGFNFVIATDTSVEGWIQIRGGQWMRAEDVSFYEASSFRGVTLLNNLEQPFGWVMDNRYTSDYPGGPQSVDNGRLVLRYALVNIFAQVEVDGWTWYMVGPDQWIEQRVMAIAKRVERPEGVSGRWLAVDLYEQTLIGYEDDTAVFATLVSTGLPNWDTNEGIFEIWARVANDGMSGATGAPEAYALQSVPWVMYFDDAISLHGTYWHDGFGYRHSHGCVNLSISDARYVFNWTGEGTPNEDGEIVTQVYVYASGDYAGQGILQD
jgi:hypothetical protein